MMHKMISASIVLKHTCTHLLGPLSQQGGATGQTGPRRTAADGGPYLHRTVEQLYLQPGETFISAGREIGLSPGPVLQSQSRIYTLVKAHVYLGEGSVPS